MRNFLVRLLLAIAATLMAAALGSSANAQQTMDPSTTLPPPFTVAQQSPQRPDAGAPATGEAQTQDALAFTGRVVKEKEKGHLVLNDPVTKMNYQLDDQSKVKPFIGKQVKVIGKLDMNSNMIHIERIEPML